MNKTGSTAIEHALADHDDRWARQLLRFRYSLGRPEVIFKHARPSDIRDIVGERLWDATFTFCFVRNPFDRLVSLYHYHQQRRADRHPLASALPFEEWLAAGGSGSAARSQVAFVTDDAGRQVVDYVGRFEHLEADFATVCDRIGIAARLDRVNSSAHRHWSTYYTPRARAIVEERFAEDLRHFGYGFEEHVTTAGTS